MDPIVLNPDSLIIRETLTDSAGPVPSFLQGNLMAGGLSPQDIPGANTDWIYIVAVAALLLFSLVRFYNVKRLNFLFNAVFSRNQANQLVREGNLFNDQFFLPLFFVFITVASLYIYNILWYLEAPVSVSWPPMLLLGAIFLAYTLFFLAKLFLLNISGWLFNNARVAFEYIHNLILFNFFSIIIFFPFVFLIAFTPGKVIIYLSFALVGMLFIFRFLRGVLIGLEDRKFSVLHLFLYLCTLEILPLLVIAKLLARYVIL